MGKVGSVGCVGEVEGTRAPLGGGDWCLCSGGCGWILSLWWAGSHPAVCFGVSVNLFDFRQPLC